MSASAVAERRAQRGIREKIVGYRLKVGAKNSSESSRSWHREGFDYVVFHENGVEESASESETEEEKAIILLTDGGKELEISGSEVVAEDVRIISSDVATQVSYFHGYDHPYFAEHPWWYVEVPKNQLSDFRRKLMKMLGIEPLV